MGLDGWGREGCDLSEHLIICLPVTVPVDFGVSGWITENTKSGSEDGKRLYQSHIHCFHHIKLDSRINIPEAGIFYIFYHLVTPSVLSQVYSFHD